MADVKQLISELDKRDLLGPLLRLAKKHHVTLEEALSDDQHAHVVRARHACMVYLSVEEGFSSTVVGRLMGRDHTTVLSALAKWRKAEREAARAQQADVCGGGSERAEEGLPKPGA